MPITEATVLHIVCDNPTCPGNELDPAERTGWTFVSSEVYGEASDSAVFCCAMCISESAAAAQEPARFAKVEPPVAAPA